MHLEEAFIQNDLPKSVTKQGAKIITNFDARFLIKSVYSTPYPLQ